jgi:hypothetical protein
MAYKIIKSFILGKLLYIQSTFGLKKNLVHEMLNRNKFMFIDMHTLNNLHMKIVCVIMLII